jgi:galactokinase
VENSFCANLDCYDLDEEETGPNWQNRMQVRELRKKFKDLFHDEPNVYRAPGRVNLIGEHTDYNDGFVMPAAIQFSAWVALAPRNDRRLRIHSENLNETVEYDLDDRGRSGKHHWSDYIRGAAVCLEEAGSRLRGADLLLKGEVPLGAGLSSSASIEVAAGYGLLDAAGIAVDRIALAQACQRAEHDFVGMHCGIMDQFISACARADQALLLDCRSLDHRYLPLGQINSNGAGVRLVICNTMVKHQLAGGEYNTRRAECEAGVRRLATTLPRIRALRDATLADLEQATPGPKDVVFRRCRHIVSENQRVLQAAEALEKGDLEMFGKLMGESHRSLRDDYEVSCPELDLMVELASGQEGVYGARMTGGGFGGCTINVVRAEQVDQFKRLVSRGYEQATGIAPEIYICSVAGGAERVDGE